MATMKLQRRDKALIAAIIAVIGAFFVFTYQKPTDVRLLDESSPAIKYLSELRSAKESMHAQKAPDGSAVVENGYEQWMTPDILKTCVTYWIVKPTGERKRFLRTGVAAPGSSGAMGAAWSSDSKAIFLKGHIAGIDCVKANLGYRQFIYTPSDGILWTLKE